MRKAGLSRWVLGVGSLLISLTCLALVMVWLWPDQDTHLVMCDVGQGDAILITQGFTQVLVDAGVNEELILQCLREHVPFWDREVDWIIPSHYDADHSGGFVGVLDRFSVKNVLLAQDSKETTDFERFYAAVLREQAEGATVHTAQTGYFIATDQQWQFSVLYAPAAKIPTDFEAHGGQAETTLWDINSVKMPVFADSNNRSTVLSFRINQVSMILTGDMEAPLEQALLENNLVTHHTILKVGHHGSKSSTSQIFLDQVAPEVALVSVGTKNRYGHPSTLVLDRLRTAEVHSVLRTDEMGTVELITDGQRVWRRPW